MHVALNSCGPGKILLNQPVVCLFPVTIRWEIYSSKGSLSLYPLYWQEKDSAPPTSPGIGPSKSAEIRAEHFFSVLFRARNHAAEIFHNFLFQKTTT